jgi:vitamin B12 transporter
VRVPRLQMSAGTDYTFSQRLKLGITAQRIEGVVDFQDVKLDDYTLVNLRGLYQISDRLKANARIENAFDEEYETVQGYGTPGRAFYLGLTASF